jgi:hypothetical protein
MVVTNAHPETPINVIPAKAGIQGNRVLDVRVNVKRLKKTENIAIFVSRKVGVKIVTS